MAPGCEHFVYTMEPSFCSGGHFYLLNHITQTLAAKKNDWLAPGDVGTNQCLAIGHAYMVWLGLELLRPAKELAELYNFRK
jgi:hypothetical protein